MALVSGRRQAGVIYNSFRVINSPGGGNVQAAGASLNRTRIRFLICTPLGNGVGVTNSVEVAPSMTPLTASNQGACVWAKFASVATWTAATAGTAASATPTSMVMNDLEFSGEIAKQAWQAWFVSSGVGLCVIETFDDGLESILKVTP